MNETDYAQLVRDAEDVAAQRTRMGVKPRGGPTSFPPRGPYEEGNITRLTNPFPETPTGIGLQAALAPFPEIGIPARIGAAALGMMLEPSEAQARFTSAMLGRRFVPVPRGAVGYKPGLVIPRSRITVQDPLRIANPGIYTKDPRQIAAEAAAMVPPEDPMLQRLFGVSRQDLFDMAQDRVRQHGASNMPSLVRLPGATRGSESAARVMVPENEQRILDALTEGQKYPQLERPMRAWYVQDPIYDRFAHLTNSPAERFNQFNIMHGMASPGSDVLTEIQRGTGAHYLARKGRFQDFLDYGGIGEPARPTTPGFPPEMLDLPGHAYHGTAQGKPMQSFLDQLAAGMIQPEDLVAMTKPKVPAYLGASGVPQGGFNWNDLVGDVHFTGGIGLHDVRDVPKYRKSITTPEFTAINPWWRSQIAQPLDMTPTEAQGFGWGLFAPQTGVTTDIGVPKLELQARRIGERAQQLGVQPEWLRDVALVPETTRKRNFVGHWAAPLFAAPAMDELLTRDEQQQ